MSFFGEERPHAPTPARLKRAREEGDAAHSHELAFAIQMVAGLGTLWFSVGTIGRGLQQATLGYWSNPAINGSDAAIIPSSQVMLWLGLQLILPLMLALFVVGAIAHLMQTQFLVSCPKLSKSRARPENWLSNVFSTNGVTHLTISAPKILVGLVVGGGSLWWNREAIFALGNMPTDAFAAALFGVIGMAGFCVGGTLLACSLLDYGVQRYRFERRNRLTDQELREELLGQTGDPQIARIRHQRMREMTHGRR